MNFQQKFLYDAACKGLRIDKRKLDEYRKIEIETGIIEKAEGSARVKIGETEVIAGIKMDVGEPFPDKPNEGILITSVEFSPIASPEFEKGPPTEDAIEVARIIDRGIRESKAIEMEKLLIEEGKVWKVFIDAHILNHDGNLIDAVGLAAIKALWNTKIPVYTEGKVNYEQHKENLPVKFKTVAVTITKIGDKLFIDSTLEEEEIADARLTIAIKDNENICALQKGGSAPFSMEELEKAVTLAKKKAEELRKFI